MKTSLFAAPTVISNGLLVAEVSPALVAASVYPVPALSMDKLLKVATPLTAFTVFVPLRVPPLGLVPIAIVTAAVLVLTKLPFASCTCTVTVGVIVAPAAVFVGCCPNVSCVAVPALTVMPVCEPAVTPLAEAEIDCVPVVFSVAPFVNVCVPLSAGKKVYEVGENVACASELLNVTVPVYPMAVLLLRSKAVTVKLPGVPAVTGDGNPLTDR
jgi:hypothetical protein